MDALFYKKVLVNNMSDTRWNFKALVQTDIIDAHKVCEFPIFWTLGFPITHNFFKLYISL